MRGAATTTGDDSLGGMRSAVLIQLDTPLGEFAVTWDGNRGGDGWLDARQSRRKR
jgi:hypothetical protein